MSEGWEKHSFAWEESTRVNRVREWQPHFLCYTNLGPIPGEAVLVLVCWDRIATVLNGMAWLVIVVRSGYFIEVYLTNGLFVSLCHNVASTARQNLCICVVLSVGYIRV